MDEYANARLSVIELNFNGKALGVQRPSPIIGRDGYEVGVLEEGNECSQDTILSVVKRRKEKGGQGDRPRRGHKTSLKEATGQLCVDADVKTDDICEKMVLMLLATFGMIAPAATATKPAISAYSIRS
jgi:hypothetical protein